MTATCPPTAKRDRPWDQPEAVAHYRRVQASPTYARFMALFRQCRELVDEAESLSASLRLGTVVGDYIGDRHDLAFFRDQMTTLRTVVKTVSDTLSGELPPDPQKGDEG